MLRLPLRYLHGTGPVGPASDAYDFGLDDQDLYYHVGAGRTTPARSIVDAAAAGTAPEQIERALREALGRALTTPADLRAAAARNGYRHRRTVLPLIDSAIRAATTALAHAPTA